jgi:hypothetical protein
VKRITRKCHGAKSTDDHKVSYNGNGGNLTFWRLPTGRRVISTFFGVKRRQTWIIHYQAHKSVDNNNERAIAIIITANGIECEEILRGRVL